MACEMRRFALSLIAITASMLALFASPVSAKVIYVKGDAVGTNTGTSWTNAYLLLQTARQAARSGDQIWVAAGTYYPTDDYGLGIGDRGKHFRLKNGVAIYGGFKGNERNRDKRDPALNVTTLSGDIGAEGDSADNCCHVFYHWDIGLNATAVLDGFTITGGTADGSFPHYWGGGMLNYRSSPTIANCTFSGNTASDGGGGIYNSNAEPTFTNCTFSENTATGAGGGMYNDNSVPTITNCTFGENTATGGGGGMYNGNSDPTITNCTFSGNSCIGDPSSQFGGGMRNDSSSAVVTNCVFSGNTANYGGGMFNVWSPSPTVTNCTFNGNSAAWGGGISNWTSSSADVTNCILWGDSAANGAEVYNNDGNPAFRYCDIDGSGGSAAWLAAFGTDGGGNIDADPLFVNAALANYRLQGASPCIDAADGGAAPSQDEEGNFRVDDPDIANTGSGVPDYADIGAYERQFMQVIFPSDSGVCVEVGKTVLVTWNSSLPKNVQLKVELVKGGAETWLLSSAAAKGQFKWTVGNWKSKTQLVYPDGADYRIRTSTADGNYGDESDEEFAIGRVTSLTVSGPANVASGADPVQYTCTAHYNFGDDRVVTDEARWSCNRAHKGFEIDKEGLLTAPSVSHDQPCTITATYGKGKSLISAELGITVTP